MNWNDIWLEAWLVCCDKSLANFLLMAEFGCKEDAIVFLEQFRQAKKYAVENLQARSVRSG